MMMRTYLAAFITFIYTSALLTAQGFDITFPYDIPTYGADIEQTTDGGFVVPCKGDTSFLKLDAQGQVEWTFRVDFMDDPGFWDPGGTSAISYSDGSIAVGGNLHFNGFTAHLDASGEVLGMSIGQSPVVNMSGNDSSAVYALHYPNLFDSELSSDNFYTNTYLSEGTFRGTVVEVAADNNHYFIGGKPGQDLSVRKYEVSHQLQTLVWEYNVQSQSYSGIWAIEEATDGTVYAVGSRYNSGITPFLVKLDAAGNVLYEKYFPGTGSLHSVREMANGNLVIGGSIGGSVIMEINPQGEVVWERRFSTSNCFSCRAIPTVDNGFALYADGNNNQVRVIKMDAEGDVYNTFLEGTMYYDVDDNCSVSSPDSLVSNKTIVAREVNTGMIYTTTSDAQGNYAIDVAAGTYEVSASLVDNWQPCQVSTVTMGTNDTNVQVSDKIYEYFAEPFSTYEGNVFVDVNGDCLFDSGDEPLECVIIALVREQDVPNGPYWYAETDENGFYSVEVPVNSYYYLPTASIDMLWGANASSGCNFDLGSIGSFETLTVDFPFADNFNVPAFIDGHVFIDENANCIRDSSELTISNFDVGFIDTMSGDTVFASALSDGYYGRILEAGVYTVFANLNGNPNWQNCDMLIVVDADGTCIDFLDVAIQPVSQCADFSVSIATSSMVICDDNILFVQYENFGTIESAPTIQVVLDTLMTYTGSSITPASVNGDTLIFNIGTVSPFQNGSFSIDVFLDCNAVLGETHCVEATINSDDDCPTSAQNWDGSSVQITGICIGDDLAIKIKNIGDNAMSEALEYIVIEDNILGYQSIFQLGAGESIELDLTPQGQSIFVEAQQAANHPTISMPAKSFEGCGANQQGAFSLGFVTQYRQDDVAENISIFCLENSAPFDPNDKQGFPRGISDQHFIESTTQMEYMIRFQNVGTAPAQDVVITDVLSELLDTTSIRAGAASHDYEMEVVDNILTFRFEGIFLPDSTSDLEGSQGFVTFIIDQTAGNSPGTEILNMASIVFDSNPAILTNETSHRIPYPLQTITSEVDLCEGALWNSTVINADTSFTQETTYLFYSEMSTVNINAHEVYHISIDTAIIQGTEFQGQVFDAPAVVVDSLLTQYGCDSIVTINVDIISGIAEFSNSSFSMVPNPTTGLIYIYATGSSSSELFGMDIYSQTGQLVKREKIYTGREIDITHLAAGVYFLKINWKDKLEVLKLVKL